jgi:[acyl-carrier-protein] S-malonyltransferase
MAAIIGLEPDVVGEVAAAAAGNDVCAVANDNGGGQIVVSGHMAAVDRAVAEAKTRGAKRTVILQVSGPFHSPLMAPAARELAAAIGKVAVRAPARAVMSNVTATPHGDPDSIRARLVEQITGTVRWRECVGWMAAHGADRFFELGAGKVLAGLNKRIAADAETASAGTPDEIAAVAARLA